MQTRVRVVTASAAALVLLAGGAAGAESSAAAADHALMDSRASLVSHETMAVPMATLRDCLKLRAGVVKTEAMGACKQTLAALEGRMVLQLDGPLTAERRSALEAAGIELGQYLPSNAWIVSTEGVDAEAFGKLEFVRWHGPFEKAWKLAGPFEDRSFVTPERKWIDERGEVVLILSLFAGADVDRAAQAVEAIPGAWVQSRGVLGENPLLTVVAPKGQAANLVDLEDVMAIEEAPEATPRMATSNWVVQSNVDGFTPLHDNGLRGEGQIVGVIDLPVNENSCVFADDVPIGPNHRKWVAINSNSSPSSHGTAVCSILAGDDESGGDLRGVAYKARMTFSRIPSFNESALINLFELHHSQGARIHSNSWGQDFTSQNFYNVWSRAIDVFTHDNEDDLVIFAATNLSTLRTPENSRNVLATAASWDTPLQDTHRTGGIGPTSDGRRKPEIVAPGSGVRAASAFSCSATSSGVGTSFACPQIAGLAALARQYYMEGYYPTGAPSAGDGFTPTGALLKATLLNSAVDMTDEPGYPTNLEGWGRALMDEALHFAGETRTLMVQDVRNSSAESLSTGESSEFEIGVTGSSEKLKITMVYTDKEAAPAAAFVPVNDLDLEVISPSGATYLGNVFSGGLSATGGSPDALNNVEQVHIGGPEIGVWTVRVVGTAVNAGTQGFALAISGEVNDPVVPCPADLTGDGQVGPSDLAILISTWGGPGIADLDGSGDIGAADLALLIAAWGECP
jgi:hypothetical protein